MKLEGNTLKYFTKEWWAAGGDDQKPVSRYRAYIESILDRLPTDAAMLAEGHLLHDAVLLRIEAMINKAQLHLELTGWTEDFNNRTAVELWFSDVKDFDITFSLDDKADYGFGDLGYYEIELLEDGYIEFRSIFSSLSEIRVIFRSLAASVIAQEQ